MNEVRITLWGPRLTIPRSPVGRHFDSVKHQIRSVVAAAVLVLMMMSAARANPFIMPPEINAPQWTTPFPYQRDISMEFDVSPVASPGAGIPGAMYEGTLDPTLKTSDFVTLSGSTSWYANVAGLANLGLLGIDNRTGTQQLTGTATFHIANTSASGTENIWVETIALTGYGGASATMQVHDPLGGAATVLPDWSVVPYGDEWLGDYELQITPNPLYETFEWSFEVPAGTYMFLDGAHLATEVPEPATLSLLALGALGALCRRRKEGIKT